MYEISIKNSSAYKNACERLAAGQCVTFNKDRDFPLCIKFAQMGFRFKIYSNFVTGIVTFFPEDYKE